ncbi:MAG TPA: glycosyltransferase family 39 protein [Polyangiaceae bacterium]|nr:glycosyltransferase family 39 protein [Polyangiaceae bacterium]
MKSLLAWLRRYPDALIAAALLVGYTGVLLATSDSLGFTRDEGFYFAASRSYGAWFELLWQSPAQALSPKVVDRHWGVNHEHPALIKSLFALSNRWFSGAFSQVSSSFRFPAMLLSGLAVALTYSWGSRVMGRAGALVAALSLGCMPHVFFHAHLACFDVPVSAMWLLTSYVYVRALGSRHWGWVLGAGVAYGLLLNTKHNSWIFPFAVLLHFALTRGLPVLRDLKARAAWWRRLPLAWVSMALLGPLLCFASWPWLWHDTVARLREYVAFHTGHEYYNMEFLGRTYWKPPMPRGYAWLMTLATVPLVTLALAAVGAAVARKQPEKRQEYAFWAVSILASYAPWLSDGTPIFGGTKHWLTAYPFLCLFAGLGFTRVVATLQAWKPRLPVGVTNTVVAACVLVGPLAMTWHSHPFGLSAYTPLVGGAPGAASLGLNRTFWGYTTQNLAPFINDKTPKRGTVYVHDTALQSFAMFQEDGRLRRDLRGSLDIGASDIALFHFEPHMSRVEQQIWIDYGSLAPDAVVTFDGVPIAWAYARRRP